MKINFNPVLCQGGTKSGLRIPKYIGPHEFKKVGGGNIGDDDFRTVGILRNTVVVRILEEMGGEQYGDLRRPTPRFRYHGGAR